MCELAIACQTFETWLNFLRVSFEEKDLYEKSKMVH